MRSDTLNEEMNNTALRYRAFGEPLTTLCAETILLPPCAPVNASNLIPITGAYSHRRFHIRNHLDSLSASACQQTFSCSGSQSKSLRLAISANFGSN